MPRLPEGGPRERTGARPGAALYRRAFESAPEALLLLDDEGRLIAANRAAASLPFPAPPRAGAPFAFLWPRAVRPAMASWLEQVAAGVAGEVEVVVPAAAGDVVLELRGCEVASRGAGRSSGAAGPVLEVLVRDITERRRLAERALQAERLASIGRLSATLAHEIRNTLAGVDGALQVFQLDEGLAAPRREILNEMRERIGRLREVVDDLLAYARPPRLSRDRWPVGEVLEAMADSAAGHPEMDDVAVRIENRCGDDAFVEVDAFHIRLVARNLVLNGAQAMAGRGAVNLTAERHQAEIFFRFADAGPGVAADVRERLFEPFFTTRAGGTGLGLPIAANIVAAHGGRLFLDAAAGPGAQFVLALPFHGAPRRDNGAGRDHRGGAQPAPTPP